MKQQHKIWIGILTATALAFGFGLPTVLSGLQDIKIESRNEKLSGDLVKLTMKSTLSTSDRFRLVNHYSSSIVLDSAQNMSTLEAKNKLKEGIDYLSQAFGSEKLQDYKLEKSSVYLRMSDEASTKSLVLWRFKLKNENGNQAEIFMDDQTGLILSVAVKQPESKQYSYSAYDMEKHTYQLAEKTGEIMEEYLGCSLDTVYMTEVSDTAVGYEILFTDESGVLFAVPVSFGKGNFSFNS